ncbi:hypothetical protein B0H14DRAFT_2580017 [Mycena olivaceomarginata]|nr:hypothetical protein B0H14DRAFT_2580017 [Mycena olivaceomarginata]
MFLLFPVVSLFLFPIPLLCGSPSSYGVQATGSQAKLALKSHEMVQGELSEWFRQVQAAGRQTKHTLKSHEMVQGELSEWFRQVQTAGSPAKLALKSHEMVQGELSEWFQQVQTAGSQAKITSDDPGYKQQAARPNLYYNHMRWSRVQTTGSQTKLALKSHEMVQVELSEWFRQIHSDTGTAAPANPMFCIIPYSLQQQKQPRYTVSEPFHSDTGAGTPASLMQCQNHSDTVQPGVFSVTMVQTTGSQTKLALKSHEMVQDRYKQQAARLNLHSNHMRWSRVQATGSQTKLALKSHEMVQGTNSRQPGQTCTKIT